MSAGLTHRTGAPMIVTPGERVPKDSPGRIATLDGLRAISILLVLTAHTVTTLRGLPQLRDSRFPGLFGDLGVRTFFVISGFLITTLLMRERAKTGAISLRGFYVRRVFRIFPAFYVYLAAVGLFSWLGWFAVSRADFLFAETYAMNYHHADARAWQVGHLWSLAVEEQFYLIWPAVLMLVGTRGAKRVAIGTLLVVPVLRTAGWYLLPELRDLSDSAFPYVADALAWGCAIALTRTELEAWPPYRALLAARWFGVVPIFGVLALAVTRAQFNLPIGVTLGNLAIAVTIHRCVLHPHGTVGRLLESAPLVWLGTLSYSIYLWQQMWIDRHSDAWPNAFPLNFVGALLCGTLSYYLVERPILRGYARLTARRKQRARASVPLPDRSR